MQALPPVLCHLIDAVAYRQDTSGLEEAWETWLSDFQAYYRSESDFTLSSEDATTTENLPFLLSTLEDRVAKALAGQADLDELAQSALDFFTVYETFIEEREKEYFVSDPYLDRLLKAAVAFLQDRAGPDAVMLRAHAAAQALEATSELFEASREELPKELVQGTEEGFRHAERGLHLLAKAEQNLTKEVVKEAVFELRSGGELLQHLPKLFQRFEEEAGSLIPVVGPLLPTLSEDPENLSIVKEQAWPAFLDYWESRQDGWLMDPEVCYPLLGEAEKAIEQLHHQLEAYPREEESFWDSVDQLEDVFEQIQVNMMNLENLSSSPYWPEAQLLLNLLRGTAPLYAAHTLAGGIQQESSTQLPPPVQTLGEALQVYLEQPEPLPLLQALKAILEDYESNKNTRPCSNCGARLPLEASKCEECGTKVELFVSG